MSNCRQKEDAVTSLSMRRDTNFIRRCFPCVGELEIPVIRRENLPGGKIDLIACSRTKKNDSPDNLAKGVHFFVDDYRFKVLRDNVESGLERYSKYAFVVSPDFSRYNEMPMWQVVNAIGMNRWCGAYWQNKGLKVFPSVGWATPNSYQVCFLGIERNSTVFVTTNGNRRSKRSYLHGYDAMLERINPTAIICLGKPFPEMRGNVIPVDYRYFGMGE